LIVLDTSSSYDEEAGGADHICGRRREGLEGLGFRLLLVIFFSSSWKKKGKKGLGGVFPVDLLGSIVRWNKFTALTRESQRELG
jgi:hypothetical protein